MKISLMYKRLLQSNYQQMKKNKYDALRDLVPFVQFKNVKTIHGGELLLGKLQLSAKHHSSVGVFSRFLNCTNGAKSRDASQMRSKLKKKKKLYC